MIRLAAIVKKSGQLGVIQSIGLGFSLLLLILLVVTGFHLSGFKKFNTYFITYQEASDLTQRIILIDKQLIELQREILAFSRTDKRNNIEQLKGKHEKIIVDLNLAIEKEKIYHVDGSGLLQKIMDAVLNLNDKIDSLKSQQKFREDIIDIQLENVFSDLHDSIEALISSTSNDENLTIRMLWMLQDDLTHVHLLSGHYFNKHQSVEKTNVVHRLSAAQDKLKELLEQTKDPIRNGKIQQTINTVSHAKKLFAQAVQADRNYSFLVNVVLAGETAEIEVLSNSIRIDYLSRQQALVLSTEQQVSYLRQVVVFSSVVGTIIAIVIALQISRNIRKPLRSITETISRLAQGEHLTEIPGTERLDEIGQLAKAADIFRQTNVRTQQLLTQTEEFSDKLQQREIELELAVHKAEAANLAKSQFLANMSHELRTPMNAILGMLSLLQRTNLTSKQLSYTEKTSSAAKLLLGILNDILDLSKAEAGKMELHLTDFNIAHLIEDIAGILTNYIADKSVQLRCEFPPDVPRYLHGDPLRLQQVLINLGANAVKFTERGSVVLSVTSQDVTDERVRLVFSIKDTGIGIAPEHQQKIFQGFTQAESAITRRFGGTGLGLAICKTLVTLMGGSLSLQSTVGQGSVFSFAIELLRLPADRIEALRHRERAATTEQSSLRLHGLHILLVEDNAINQEIALELLENEGAVVSVAINGQQAVERLQQQRDDTNKIDIVLMDLQMPVMDGISATQYIRTDLQLVELPIIAMTANAMTSDREDCLRAGMNDHIGKPFNLYELIELIRRYCKVADTNATTTTRCELTTSSPQPVQQAADGKLSLIDVEDAVARIGGKKSLYLKVLPQFRQRLLELPAQLHTLAALDDITGLARELHSFKGASALMGAAELSNGIAGLEKQLRHTPPPTQLLPIVEQACELIGQYSEVFSALAERLSQEVSNIPT